MNARLTSLIVVLALAPAVAWAQESNRNLKGGGPAGAFLTPGQIDRWLFEGEKGESVAVHVSSTEFDPLLGLSREGAKGEETVVPDVDDPGTEGRFMIRLPERGQYRLRVRAFKDLAGGNYRLSVRRFRASPLATGKPAVGAFDAEGKGYHVFQGAEDRVVVPQLRPAGGESWAVLDPKGREVPAWLGSVAVGEPGEWCLVASGQPQSRYEVLLREARRRDLAGGEGAGAGGVEAPAGQLRQNEMEVISFQGKPGDFRLVEVEKKGALSSRLLFAPPVKGREQSLARPGERPEVQFLPVASRGGKLRYAALLGRAGRYQLQLLASTDSSYRLSVRDPGVPLVTGKGAVATLPVGGAAFYTFEAAPGQLVQASLASKQFVPLLRLYDPNGRLVGSSGAEEDAEGDAQDGSITHMAVSGGLYRLQVASLGDGGGGEYRCALREVKLGELTLGGRGKGKLPSAGTEFWAFTGKEGQTVFLSVRSAAFTPVVSLRGPDGVRLVAENRGHPATGSLVALRLPRSGRYTVWVASGRGAGDYVIRLLDGD